MNLDSNMCYPYDHSILWSLLSLSSGNPFTPSSSTINWQAEFGRWGANNTFRLRTFAWYVLGVTEESHCFVDAASPSCNAMVTYCSVLDNIRRVVTALAQLSPSAGTLPLLCSTGQDMWPVLNASDTWQMSQYHQLTLLSTYQCNHSHHCRIIGYKHIQGLNKLEVPQKITQWDLSTTNLQWCTQAQVIGQVV